MKFTVAQYKEISDRYTRGESITGIAHSFGIKTTTITRILNRQQVEMRDWRTKFSVDQETDVCNRYKNRESLEFIAQGYGVSPLTIKRVLHENNIDINPKGNRYREFTDDEIERIKQMADTGMAQTVIATHLGSSQITISRIMSKYGISDKWKRKIGTDHQWWTGGKTKAPGGYMQILVYPDSPYYIMANRTGYILEHRLVMAKKLGRPLLHTESVHHIDGNRTNNDISNLQLRHGRHGNGIAYCCADCGSHNIIEVSLTEKKV